jgi:hypothetical protein
LSIVYAAAADTHKPDPRKIDSRPMAWKALIKDLRQMKAFLSRFKQKSLPEEPPVVQPAPPLVPATLPARAQVPAPAPERPAPRQVKAVPSAAPRMEKGPLLPAPAAKNLKPISEDTTIRLELGDFLDRIPSKFLQPGEHDRSTEVRFDLDFIGERIGRGTPGVPMTELYRRVPKVFRTETVTATDVEVRFPWQKVMRILSTPAEPDKPAAITRAGLAALARKIQGQNTRRVVPGQVSKNLVREPAVAQAPEPDSEPCSVPHGSLAPMRLQPSPVADQAAVPHGALALTPATVQPEAAADLALDPADQSPAVRQAALQIVQVKGEHKRQIAALMHERQVLGEERDKALAEADRVRQELAGRIEQVEFEKTVAKRAGEKLRAEMAQIREQAAAELAQVIAERDSALLLAASQPPSKSELETIQADWDTRAVAQLEADIETYRGRIKTLIEEKAALKEENRIVAEKLTALTGEHEQTACALKQALSQIATASAAPAEPKVAARKPMRAKALAVVPTVVACGAKAAGSVCVASSALKATPVAAPEPDVVEVEPEAELPAFAPVARRVQRHHAAVSAREKMRARTQLAVLLRTPAPKRNGRAIRMLRASLGKNTFRPVHPRTLSPLAFSGALDAAPMQDVNAVAAEAHIVVPSGDAYESLFPRRHAGLRAASIATAAILAAGGVAGYFHFASSNALEAANAGKVRAAALPVSSPDAARPASAANTLTIETPVAPGVRDQLFLAVPPLLDESEIPDSITAPAPGVAATVIPDLAHSRDAQRD